MTVQELISLLEDLPKEALIVVEDLDETACPCGDYIPAHVKFIPNATTFGDQVFKGPVVSFQLSE